MNDVEGCQGLGNLGRRSKDGLIIEVCLKIFNVLGVLPFYFRYDESSGRHTR